MLVRAVAFALLVSLLAGCAGETPSDAAPDDGAASPQERALMVHLDASSSVPAPEWAIGQWWEWEISFATETLPDTFRSIVVATDGTTYTLATENDAIAKEEAAFNTPLLGPVQRTKLAMDGWGDQPWSLLEFPLTDGKSWTATMPNIAWDVVAADTAQLAVTASFDPDIGEHGGFRLEGMTQGAKVMEADYDPSTGWFAGLRFHDVDPGQEGLEIGYRAKSTGLDHAGPYFQHTARELLAFEDLVGFDNVPTEGGQPYTAPPQPHHTFTMGEGTTLFGYIGAASVAGARGLVLVDPTSQHRLVAVPGAPEAEEILFLDEPGKPGEWRLVTAGAGGFSGAFVYLAEVTEGAFEMTAGARAT